jgi:hypothetical protein
MLDNDVENWKPLVQGFICVDHVVTLPGTATLMSNYTGMQPSINCRFSDLSLAIDRDSISRVY